MIFVIGLIAFIVAAIPYKVRSYSNWSARPTWWEAILGLAGIGLMAFSFCKALWNILP